MTLTIRFLNEMFRQWGERIDKPLEAYLLATYEEEPFPHVWSEEDLFEQVRKIIFQYDQGILDIKLPSPLERQNMRYEELKESYMELLGEVIKLRGTIHSAAETLARSNHPIMFDEVGVINF